MHPHRRSNGPNPGLSPAQSCAKPHSTGWVRTYARRVAHVLLIEDDDRIRRSLARLLAERGHEVDAEAAGLPGLQRLIDRSPDVVVLDLGLPDIDGVDLLRMVRATSQVPVIVATARDGERDIVTTLDAGADDHVAKPFSAEQLEARIRAVLRRANAGGREAAIHVGDLTIDPAGRTASLADEALDLSRLEFDLLLALARRPGEVIPRGQLFAEVWRQPYGGGDKTLDVHLSWLRRKLGETAAHPRYLHTVRGVGIKLSAPDG